MATPAVDDAVSLKTQANAEFAQENYLKAAALYTKAIKLDPTNAVLFSNRSAALLKLKKVTKALEDAEECIRSKPDWEKGYFRKAAVLEEMQNFAEALEVYQLAQSKNPGSKDLVPKIRGLQKLVQGKKGGKDGPPAPPAQKPAAPKTAAPKPAAAAVVHLAEEAVSPAPPKDQQTFRIPMEDLGSAEVTAFVKTYIENLVAEVQEGGADTSAVLHFLPGTTDKSFEEEETHVRGAAAFDSPDTLGGFVEYLQSCGERFRAQAVLLIAPKSAVAFPQTWNKPGWKGGKDDGYLIQLEARVKGKAVKSMWFAPCDRALRSISSPLSLDPEVFGLLPPLLR